MSDLTSEDKQIRALARLDEEVIDLDEEGQRLLALVKFTRESVANQITSGLGHKQLGMSKADLAALKELAIIFERVTSSIARLDKTQDIRSKKLTRAQYLEVAKKLVLSQTKGERGQWLTDVRLVHERLP